VTKEAMKSKQNLHESEMKNEIIPLSFSREEFAS
jgi:hypothetical protein